MNNLVDLVEPDIDLSTPRPLFWHTDPQYRYRVPLFLLPYWRSSLARSQVWLAFTTSPKRPSSVGDGSAPTLLQERLASTSMLSFIQ